MADRRRLGVPRRLLVGRSPSGSSVSVRAGLFLLNRLGPTRCQVPGCGWHSTGSVAEHYYRDVHLLKTRLNE